MLKPECFDGEISDVPHLFVSSMSPLPLRRKFQTTASPVAGDAGVPNKSGIDVIISSYLVEYMVNRDYVGR